MAEPKLWNELKEEVKYSTSVYCFKREVKTYLFTKAFKEDNYLLTIYFSFIYYNYLQTDIDKLHNFVAIATYYSCYIFTFLVCIKFYSYFLCF